MKNMYIDGKKMAQELYDELKNDIQKSQKKPKLAAILVWSNSASLRYISQKKKFAEYVWIDFQLIEIKQNATQIELEKKIEELNNNSSIDGYIVQLPLPDHIDSNKIIERIDPKKDVDGFHPVNMWKVLIGDTTGLVPCTPAWVMYMLKKIDFDLIWKKVTIVWRSNIVWKPLAWLLINAWATVNICNSHTQDIKAYTSQSDLVIMATWKPHLLNVGMVKIGTTIIDVWFSVVDGKILWDCDTQILEKVWNTITPVPGWVWPLTVAMLMKNTYQASLQK